MYHILKLLKVVLVHRIFVNSYYQQDPRDLYTFVPNKPFCNLLEISLTNFNPLKTFNSEFQTIEVWLQIKIVNHYK